MFFFIFSNFNAKIILALRAKSLESEDANLAENVGNETLEIKSIDFRLCTRGEKDKGQVDKRRKNVRWSGMHLTADSTFYLLPFTQLPQTNFYSARALNFSRNWGN